MRSWTNQNKLLTQLRKGAENQALADPVSARLREEPSSSLESTSSRRSAEFLELAQAAGGFGVFELNLVTGHIEGTSLFFDLIGLECADMSLTREEWLASIHPEDLESVVRALSDAVASGSGYETEYRTLTAAGEIRWLAGRGQVLLGSEGYDSRAIGTITDITERKALEDKPHYATARRPRPALPLSISTSAAAAASAPAISVSCRGSSAPPVDRAALRELTGGDAEFERELADTFVSSGDQCLAEILAALKVSDFDTVRKRAHSLKGASANIHALDLSKAASSLEDAARENSIPALGGLVADLAEKLAAVNAELRQAG